MAASKWSPHQKSAQHGQRRWMGEDRNYAPFTFNNFNDNAVAIHNPNKKENVRLEIDMHTIVGGILTVTVYGEFDNTVQVDPNSSVFHDIYQWMMESVALSDQQLSYLAKEDPLLKPHFWEAFCQTNYTKNLPNPPRVTSSIRTLAITRSSLVDLSDVKWSMWNYGYLFHASELLPSPTPGRMDAKNEICCHQQSIAAILAKQQFW